jgi:hypothetical protein
MRPDIDRSKLSADTRQWLSREGLTTRSASAAFSGLNPAMISRACNEQVLSAASLLVLCRAMRRNPMRYLLPDGQQKQPVTPFGKRETPEARP